MKFHYRFEGVLSVEAKTRKEADELSEHYLENISFKLVDVEVTGVDAKSVQWGDDEEEEL